MTGQQFRAIRAFNKISQERLAYKLGYANRSFVYLLEKQTKVQERFVKILGQEIGVNLLDEKITDKYYNELDEKWKKRRTREGYNMLANTTIHYPAVVGEHHKR